jgi:membrane protein
MLAYLKVPIGWGELLKRTAKEFVADDMFDLAAQQAYYFFFALFPAILFVIAVASFFPLQSLIDNVVQMLGRIAPDDVTKIVTDAMTSLSKQNSGGVLTFAFIVTIWSSSGAMVSIITTLNAAYDVTESRPWWKTRLTAIALTGGIAVFIIASMFLIVAGPTLVDHLATSMNLGPAFTWAWRVLQWPVVFLFIAVAIGLVYYFAPDVEQDWVWITPGSILATTLWLIVSIGLKLYYQMMPNANAAYGTIGGVMVLMLWFYVSGLALLLGAELNAEIEHASPHGKAPGERVPGEKKVIGPRARRLYDEKQAKGVAAITPLPDGVNGDIDRAPAPGRAGTKLTDLIIGTLALGFAVAVTARKFRNEVKKRA